MMVKKVLQLVLVVLAVVAASALPLEGGHVQLSSRKVLQSAPDPCANNADCGQDPCLPIVKGTASGRYCVCDGGYENGGYLNGGPCSPTPGQEAPVGTLVSTWEAIEAKSDGGQFWGTPISKYAWFSTNADYSTSTFLVFSLKRLFVVGPNQSKTYLKLTPQCDRYTTSYPSTEALYNSCKGTATFTEDAQLTGFWAILEGPLQAIQIQQPFARAEFSVQLVNTLPEPKSATYLGQAFDFGSAPSLPNSAPNVGRLGTIGSASLGPFPGSGTLTFKSLTLKVAYTGASAKKGDTLSWLIPYTSGRIVGKTAPPKVTTEYEFNLQDPCKGNPCGVGGRCSVVQSYTYQCACFPGFRAESSGTACLPQGSGDPYNAGF